jgi:hypothetical protein
MPTDNELCGTHTEAIKNLKESDKMQWEAIERLQNRLPMWATTIISILTFGIGCISTYAVMLRNIIIK